MDIGIRSRLTTGFAAVSVGALVLSPVTPGEAPTGVNWSTTPTVTLTAAAQSLPAATVVSQPATAAATQQQQPAISLPNPLNPLIQQVSFHVTFLTDFVTTGAVLFRREFAIPGALLASIHNGTSAPAALSQALQTFAQIELEAGRDLVGFAAQYVSFQLNFLTSLPGMVTMPLAAAKQPTTPLLVALNPMPMTKLSTVQLSNAAAGTQHPKKVKSSASVGSSQTATDKRTTGGAGTQHQPRHEHDGHPRGGDSGS
jgi:hypothetical protein